MAREIELKFDVDEGSAASIGDASPLKGIRSRRAKQRSDYYDTPEEVLRKAGYALRIRRTGKKNVLTVKHQPGGGAGLFDRPEWETPLAAPGLDPEVLAVSPVGPALSDKDIARLKPVTRTEFERTTWTTDGLEVTLDEGFVSAGRRKVGLTELELELRDGEPARLFDFAHALAAEIPLRLGVLSKIQRGEFLAEKRLGKAVKAEPIAVHSGMTVAEGFSAIARACLRHYRLNEMVLLEHDDPAALHQARVAMRRLRSAFSLFGKAVRDREFDDLREELRWYTGQFGDARNLDVFMKRLPKEGKKAEAGEIAVRAALKAARDDAYQCALTAMRSPRQRMLMLGLVRWVETGAWREKGKAQRPLTEVAAKRIERRWRKIEEKGAELATLPPEPRHRLRINIKKMRYASEFVSGLYGDEPAASKKAEYVAALEKMQDALGELNDADTAHEILDRLTELDPQERSFAEGLVGSQDEQACIDAAERAYRHLIDAGPFWRKDD